MIRALVALAAIVAPAPCMALSLVLVRENIEVDVNFSGGKVTALAVSDRVGDPDVSFAFALVGPITRYRVVHRSDQVEARVFYAPSVLSILAEARVYSDVPDKVRQDAGLDPLTTARPAPVHLYDPPPPPIWYEALAGLKTEAGVFSVDTRVIRLDEGLVRADLPLPAQSPVGEYRVRAVMFKGDEILAVAEKRVTLRRRGAEHFLYALSKRSGALYGLLAVMVGLTVGAIGSWFGRT